MKLYNTLTRKKEEFAPLDGKTVRMYSCGPTVYNFAHIGNMRTYIFMDILRRTLRYEGYKVKGVMNITDVGHLLSDADEGEDKMEKAAKEQRKSPYEIADFYTKVFFDDLKKLNIGKPELTPKATEHIREMLDFVYALCEKGYGYETSDGIYFDISKFPAYGQLSGINLEDQKAGARVEVNDEKRSPFDFAIWKKAPKEHIMQWDSRWGKGYPGWHIECSAMSKKYLGEVFDIHTGGVDHIPIHHENEIAQSYGYSGKNPAKFWMHGEFMLVNNGKMSKKLGNTYLVSQLEEMGYSPMCFRYFCLNTHYRKKLNFTFEGMDGAKTAYARLCALVAKHREGENDVSDEKLAAYRKEFEEDVTDDLNVPGAMGVLWTMLKEPASRKIYALALEMDKVFGLKLDEAKAEEVKEEFPAEITAIANERAAARAAKDWGKSDELRAKLDELGYAVKDTKEGYTLTRK
ncbi:cysteine--tRNA ligase [Candidatus Borkfalkia ceftriaxoniphila]|uniref:Cysteine--tRNA ligase n=1 Tax=Candidatus Borkfalkia ceftriaxoniphila TaxID=2508949 RepID=A0A4Q2KAR1_9FIRM|nr:cysteine--tRNA ligase [Candidatus Borkfalkia ceftriaxoniphila]RXZ61655.1 cysteine--tRNA ligase [Candidatus Borkfalkia ceftriaxoniphila]